MIHRTREGGPPSGAPEPGREVVQIGDVFVEYSGAVPTQTDLDAHLRPPTVEEPSGEQLFELGKAKGLWVEADRPKRPAAARR